MAIRHPRMNIRTLTPELLAALEHEVQTFIDLSNELKTQEFVDYGTMRQRQIALALIIGMSGLSEKRAHDLIAGRTSIATYWLPNGTVRKDY